MSRNIDVKRRKRILYAALMLVFVFAALLAGCGDSYPASDADASSVESAAGETSFSAAQIDRDGTYDSKEDVAAYISEYRELPQNYITKNEARELGWDGGSVEKYARGKCIGGDRFGNYEGALPKSSDRDFYHECDIGTLGKSSRGAKRIIYSKDGDIYYTDDHYETFTKIE